MKYCPLTGMYVPDNQSCELRLGGIQPQSTQESSGKFNWNTITEILEIGGQVFVGVQNAKNQPQQVNNYITPDIPTVDTTGIPKNREDKKSALPYIIGGVALLALVYFLIIKK